jgi:uncharacterized membrane protein
MYIYKYIIRVINIFLIYNLGLYISRFIFIFKKKKKKPISNMAHIGNMARVPHY